jgi:hypothetical protein
VDVKLEFIPGTTLAASNSTISFIQIVSSSLWNSDGSSEVDTTRNDVGPYYGARWDEGSQEWVDEPTATQAPGSPMGSTEGSRRFSASNASAILNDSPMMDDGETKYFETAIVIIESGQILGSFFWTVRNDSGITLARNVHLETSASAELSAVLRCFYVRNPINIRPKDGSAPSDLR